MAERIDDTRRQVVPRWWTFSRAADMGELGSAISVRQTGYPELNSEGLAELMRDWTKSPNSLVAANLVDFALGFNRPEVGVEAAEWILLNGGVSEVSTMLAQQLISPTNTFDDVPSVSESANQHGQKIAEYRSRLRRAPRDPLLWVDLAREYSSLGQLAHAKKALIAAIGLAPNNRFVLRSASRFFLHAHDPEFAHELLLRTPATVVDPWLMAAEIVAAQANDKSSRLVKKGRLILQSGKMKPRHLSELASAIGTLEHRAGRRKEVRRLFGQALIDPTENSVAQAAWVGRHMLDFDISEKLLSTPRAFEARSWRAVQTDNLEAAVDLAGEWLADEPFATRPAMLGSWVAAVGLGNYRVAADLVRASMRANPDDPRLVAQLLYCAASDGDVNEAERQLPILERLTRNSVVPRSDAEWSVILSADRGLICFRRGMVDEGRIHYERALAIASHYKLKEAAASAQLNYAREKTLANPRLSPNIPELELAVQAFPVSTRAVANRFLKRLNVSSGVYNP